MSTLSQLVKAMGIAVLLSAAAPVFAESAPVYDADAMPMDNNVGGMEQVPAQQPSETTVGQDYPDNSVFVPMQHESRASDQAPKRSELSSSLEQRLGKLEQQVDTMRTSGSSARIESLQNEVQSLRGQVEELTHQLKLAQSQQKSMYADLDKRMSQQASSNADETLADTATVPAPSKPELTTSRKASKIARKTPIIKQPKIKPDNGDDADVAETTTVAAATTTTTKSAANQPNVAEEQQIYQTAYNFIKAKKYNNAVDALQKMLRKYPSGQFAANAHYWLGELYGLMGKNDQALSEFGIVVKTFPDSPRVSDAQLKVGLLQSAQFKWPEAKSTFKKIINHYPGSASARLAEEQLRQIKLAGH